LKKIAKTTISGEPRPCFFLYVLPTVSACICKERWHLTDCTIQELSHIMEKSAVAREEEEQGKNIVILCDGTGQEIQGDTSNVLRLFRILKQRVNKLGAIKQAVFYDPGLGTLEHVDAWSQVRVKTQQALGLATGWGLDANVLQAYRFLTENYEEGDQIFLFGFSRGAYSVRVLAGMLFAVGFLQPDQANLAGYAMVVYKRAGNIQDKKQDLSNDTRLKAAFQFGDRAKARRVPIQFVGCWDTVSSVFVPGGPSRIFLPTMQTLPYTASNPGVRHFRHACAIDERRRYFRVNHWKAPDGFKLSPFLKAEGEHTTKKIWFVGCHGDVGGGWPEEKSGLAKISLNWMIDEAVECGLEINASSRNWYALGKPSQRGNISSVKPSAMGPINNSMTPAYRIFDIVPSGPRRIPADHDLHESVYERMEKDKSYNPPNLKNYLAETKRKRKSAQDEETATSTHSRKLQRTDSSV